MGNEAESGCCRPRMQQFDPHSPRRHHRQYIDKCAANDYDDRRSTGYTEDSSESDHPSAMTRSKVQKQSSARSNAKLTRQRSDPQFSVNQQMNQIQINLKITIELDGQNSINVSASPKVQAEKDLHSSRSLARAKSEKNLISSQKFSDNRSTEISKRSNENNILEDLEYSQVQLPMHTTRRTTITSEAFSF